jgi:soluble lytic murein transglycosylase-like protein
VIPGYARPLAFAALLVAGCAGTPPAKVPPAPPARPAAPESHAREPRSGAFHPSPWTAAAKDRHPPRRTSKGIEWCRPRPASAPWAEEEAWRGDRGTLVPLDSLSLWRVRAMQPEWGEPALLRWSARRAAAGDTLGADSVLASPELASSIWGWDAVRARSALALARGDTVAADTLLHRAKMRGWPDADFAAWTAEAARLAVLRGDTTRALGLASDAMRRFPSLPGASLALALTESITVARHDSLALEDERIAAGVESLRGSFGAAARRLIAMIPRQLDEDRGRGALQAAEAARRARTWDAARGAVVTAERAAGDSTFHGHAMLEHARILRDAGKSDSALALYARAAARAGPGPVREVALWERAREFQDAGRFPEAAAAFATMRAAGTRRPDVRFLEGLMRYASGRADSALALWGHDTLEASLFWRGVELHRRRDPVGDSLLREVAARPGYLFYRTAARDTLGIRGIPDSSRDVPPAPASAIHSRLWTLAEAGLIDEALRIATRRLAHDVRLAPVDSLTHREALDDAYLAYVFGRPSAIVSFVLQAQRLAAELPTDEQWSLIPWAYPPAYDSLVVAVADSLRLEPALVWATMRQESRFDPAARSTSNALGLMQLLLPAAQDAARLGKELRPTSEAPLLDPATNLKWGARYLNRLIQRFDGHVAVALSAYNAGPSTVPPFWRDLIARGGEALFCEIASNADAQDYARRILGYRSAYRELRPRIR